MTTVTKDNTGIKIFLNEGVYKTTIILTTLKKNAS